MVGVVETVVAFCKIEFATTIASHTQFTLWYVHNVVMRESTSYKLSKVFNVSNTPSS